MDHKNVSLITYFFITGISDDPFVFLLVLLIYLMTLGGNITIFLLICFDNHLHTPMYFFLANLSILDISCSTITFHKIFTYFISGDNIVSVHQCLVQIIVFLLFSCYELLVLAVMGYDRYVAICKPLHYNLLMNFKRCALLVVICWICGIFEYLTFIIEIFKLTCFKSNKMDHFFCDIIPFLNLTCNDISFLQLYIYIVGGLVVGFIPFFLIFISYIFIIGTILSIRSSTGRRKAFYTCSSHLTVVICFYTSLSLQYVTPSSARNLDISKYLSLLNGAAVPFLNPLIYSLKNKDVKAAIRRSMRR
ncbi:olfactory receptor 8G17-like [Dendrobates tinctorius]|uniref:olfactory receptor 8G17-like n=1 Tax=Dendrobates tinctorius TaxID=92724 RepID=UPI003CCA5950